jgi:hypothetical protein
MKSLKPTRYLSLLLVFFIGSAFTSKPSIDEEKTVFDLMNYTEVLEVSMHTNFELLDSLRKTNTYQPATFSFVDANGEESKWGIKVRTRGKYRRRICDQPPIKLNFDKDELKDAGLSKDDELKLVTQCIDGSDGKDYVLREYLAYKIYQILTEVSLKAQLIEINYHCTATGDLDRGWGIILEDKKSLATRFDSDVCDDCYGRKKESFDPFSLSVASLYQYMVSNADFSVALNKNLLILDPEKEEEGKLSLIAPYDFDFSGLVNANYARPRAEHGQTSVRDRVFLGLSSDEELAPAIEHFKSKKEEILEFVKNFKVMKGASRRDVGNFIEEFYENIDEGITRSPIEAQD